MAAIVTRAALRTLPTLGGAELSLFATSVPADLALLVFQATLTSMAIAVSQADDAELLSARAAEVAFSVHTAARAANTDVTIRSGAMRAAEASAYAVRAAATCASEDAALAVQVGINRTAAISIATVGNIPSRVASKRMWRAVSNDALVLMAHSVQDPVKTLLQSPLWPHSDAPEWAHKCWAALTDDQILLSAGFTPWFEWYERLLPLPGSTLTASFTPDLIRRIAQQPGEWWNRETKAVNRDIAAWLAEPEAITDMPPQMPAAFRFRTEGGQIKLAPLNTTATDSIPAQVFLDDLRERAAAVVERLESARNAVPFLASEVTRLHDFLPIVVSDLNPYLLRGRLVTIEAAVESLHSAGASRELSDDPTIQVTALAYAGRELLLCFPDLRSREREEIARSIPLGQEQSIAESLTADAKAAALVPEVVTEEAAAALDTISTMAREAVDGTVDAQRVRIVEQVAVVRNFRSEVVRFGWDLWDQVKPGALDGAGLVSKHAVIFGFAGLVSSITNPVVGLAALFAGYGQVNRALELLEEQFTKRAKELEESEKKTNRRYKI